MAEYPAAPPSERPRHNSRGVRSGSGFLIIFSWSYIRQQDEANVSLADLHGSWRASHSFTCFSLRRV